MTSGDSKRTGREYHVSSFVLHVTPKGEASVQALADSDAAVEIHASEGGKMVVTAEAGHMRDLARLADRLAELPGVLQRSPVYHEFDAGDPAGAQPPETRESHGSEA